jgi:apolipoprotein N-acyltransferase
MWDSLLSGQAAWFGVPALLGTGLFILKLGLMLLGHHGGDFHDADVHGDVHDPNSSDAAFKLITIQGALAFCMGFGWTGVGLRSGTDWSAPAVAAVSIAAGVATMYIMGAIMASMMQLQSSGNIDIHAAVGAEGAVYTTVPAENAGGGQVTIVLDERQRTYDAITPGPALPRNTRVRVIAITGQNTLTVIPA